MRGESYAQTATGRRLLGPGVAVLVGSTVETGMQSALVMRMGVGTEVGWQETRNCASIGS